MPPVKGRPRLPQRPQIHTIMLTSSVYCVLLSLCVATVRASYSVYTATLDGASAGYGAAPDATGEVTVFVEDPSEADGLYTLYCVGSVSDLEPITANTSCEPISAECGNHIHSTAELFTIWAYNPLYWIPNKYTTTSEGYAELNWVKDIDRGDIGGQTYVVHNATEYFAAVGILIQQTSDVWSVTTAEVNSSGVSGSATLFTTGTNVVVAGKVSGLSADVTDCSATNGCGVHVHSGTSCDSMAPTAADDTSHGNSRMPWVCSVTAWVVHRMLYSQQ